MSDICRITCKCKRQLPIGYQKYIVTIHGEHVEEFAFANWDNTVEAMKCANIVEAILASTITSICQYAFLKCTSLKYIRIPPLVVDIGMFTFAHCTSLKEVEVPPSVTSIGDFAFYSCTSLTSIVIPPSVTTIGTHAFAGCTSLRRVVWFSCISPFDDFSVFSECYNLRELITDHSIDDVVLIKYRTVYNPIIRVSKIPDKTHIRALCLQYFDRCGVYTTDQRDFISIWLLIWTRLLVNSTLYLPLELWMLILSQLKRIELGVCT